MTLPAIIAGIIDCDLTIAASVRFSIFLKSFISASELATALKWGLSGVIMLSPHEANQ